MDTPDVSLGKLARRGVRMRVMRLLLTVVSVAAGVSFFAGTSIVSSSVRNGFSELFQQFNEGVDFQVRATRGFGDDFDGRALVDETVGEKIAALDEVARVEPVLFREVTVLGPAGPVVPSAGPSALIAVSDDPLPGVDIRTGRGPRGGDEAVVDTRTARILGVDDLPARVTILAGGQQLDLSVVGTISQAGAEDYLGAVIVGVHPSQASAVAGTPGQVDALAVVLRTTASTEDFQLRVGRLLGDGLEAVPGSTVVDEQLALLNRFLGPFSTALIGFAVIALFVAAFIVTNTFSIGVSQRIRELAVMKAIGAGNHQLVRLVLTEAVFVGAIASVAGLAGGYGVAQGIVGLLTGAGGFPAIELSVSSTTIGLALLAGTGLTTVASLRPALRAGRLSPMAAFGDAVGPVAARRPTRSIVTFLVGSGLFALGTLSDLPTRTAIATSGVGGFLIFAATPGAGALVVGPVARAIAFLRRNAIVWLLAAENARRTPRRTAAAAAAMTVGLSLVAAVTVTGAAIGATLDATFDDNVRASHVARAGTQGPGGIPPEYGEDLRSSGAFTYVVGVSLTTVAAGGQGRSVSAVDGSGFTNVFDLTLRAGTLELKPGDVALDVETAAALNASVGDPIVVTFLDGASETWEVIGVFDDPGLLLSGMIADKTTVRRPGLLTPSDRYVVAGGAVADWDAKASAVAASYPQVSLQTLEDFARDRRQQIDRLLGVVNALLALTVLVATIGIANTLSLTVLERSREIGLLRAVGADRAQVRGTIRVEALIVGLLGGMAGTVLGAVMGVLLCKALPPALTGVVEVPFGRLAALAVAGVVTGLLASWWPARKAARSDILAAVTVD